MRRGTGTGILLEKENAYDEYTDAPIRHTRLKDQVTQNSPPPRPDRRARRRFRARWPEELKIVTDGGPVLNYTFKSANRLTLAEGKRLPSRRLRRAELQQMVFLPHGPWTLKVQRLSTPRALVTVFEVWFAGARPVRAGT